MEQYIKDARATESARRLKGFGLHLTCYFVTMIVLVALNVSSIHPTGLGSCCRWSDGAAPWPCMRLMPWGSSTSCSVTGRKRC